MHRTRLTTTSYSIYYQRWPCSTSRNGLEKECASVRYRVVCFLAWGYNAKVSKKWRCADAQVHLIRAQAVTLPQVELQLPVSQALALFVKLIRKISGNLQEIQKTAISATIPISVRASPDRVGTTIHLVADAERGLRTMETELKAAGDEATAALREKQRAMIDSLDLSR